MVDLPRLAISRSIKFSGMKQLTLHILLSFIKGVIADYGLTLDGLMDFMTVFFGKMGINKFRFKPAYNPYAEPSMEIFSFHKGLNKLVEIGNSSMFRPEMLESMVRMGIELGTANNDQ
ncbi:tRNA synthetases class II core domain (F)-domain-containing protein [Xylaria acuta]|nr:tRNA synthetases class II core domain (F)-domain-containing protein [Xylaria acuta]